MLARSRVLVAAICIASPAHAQSTIPSIDEATFLQRVAANPRARALAERSHAARAAVGAAAVLPNPTLTYEREAVPSIDVHEDFVRLGWTLDVAGRRGLAADAARAGADAERASAVHAELALRLDARLAFAAAQLARDHLARLDEARTVLATLVDALRTRAQQGDTSSYDLDRAALELQLLDDERAEAQRELAVAQLRLGAFVGEPHTPYDARGALVLPAKPPDALRPARPDVDAARARERQASRELASARRGWIPRFELMVGVLSTSASDELGYVAGIGGELPVFDRGGAQAAKARAEVKRWRAEAAALESEVTGEVAQARAELIARIAQAERFAAGPGASALDLQRRATVAYREGDRTILELLDVQRTSRQAVVRALELVYAARRAELALARALGRQP
jgi:cobalt-zinc-cadmium efflux system outer membrane protein